MARVTVEDCIEKVPNRYELLMVAAQRAKDIESGAPLQVNRDNDKNSVVALREIAEGRVSIEELQKSLVMNLQKYVEVEESEEEEIEILTDKKELSELDSQFDSSMLLDSELNDSMQIHDEDSDINLEDDSDADLDDGDLDVDDSFDDDMSDDFADENEDF